MHNQQSCPLLSQGLLELGQGLVQEPNPAVGRGQPLQNLAVKDKDQHQGLRMSQGLRKGRVVFEAQVPPQPDQLAGRMQGVRVQS